MSRRRHLRTLLCLPALMLGVSSLAEAAPSDLDTSLVNDSVTGSGTGALIGFAQTSKYAQLNPDGTLSFLAWGASCYTAEQKTGNLYITLTSAGQFHSIQGPACADGSTPGSIARASVANGVKLSTGKFMLQADTEGLDIRLRLIRLNADGSVDTSFGNQGQLLVNKSDDSAVLTGVGLRDPARMVVDTQDRLYISAGGNEVVRLSADGVLDTSFGDNGYVRAPFVESPGTIEGIGIRELALDSQNRLIVAGSHGEPAEYVGLIQRYWLARFDSNGQHDTSFRNDLGLTHNIVRLQALPGGLTPSQPVYSLQPEADGNLLVTVGTVSELRRYASDGSLSATIGMGLGPEPMLPLFTGVDGSGRILVAGQNGIAAVGIARLHADLSLDTSFDAGAATPNGIATYNLGSSRSFRSDHPGTFVFGSDGKITLVGRVTGQGNATGIAVIRLMGDGGGSGPVNDTVPDDFSFGINENAAANSTDTSAARTITGIDVAVPISINIGQGRAYSVGCNGTFRSDSSTITNGQSVCVRHDTGSPGTRIVTTLTIGGVQGTFESVVPAPVVDTTPDAFSFTAVNDAEPGAVVQSAAREISGINTGTPISISGGEYRVLPDGQYSNASGTLAPGSSVQVRVTASATAGASATATLNIGGVTGSFVVTTRMPPQPSTVTLPNVPGGSATLTTAGGTIVNARTVTAPAAAPAGFTYPHGFFAFDVEDVAPGSEVTVQLTLPAGSTPNAYVKCNAAATLCSEFAGASFNGNVVTLILRDGGEGDADGAVNGRIVDPGAPVVKEVIVTEQSKGGGALGGWPLLAIAAMLFARRRMGPRR